MSETAIVIAMFIAFLVALFLGTPLIYVLGGLSIIFGFLFWGDTQIISLFVRTTTKLATTTSYVCVPLFVIMGTALEKSGAADELFEAIHVLLGRVRGGLAIATIFISAMMGAATGVLGASITIMGLMALPTMLRCGYSKVLASGTVMAGGALGALIPPEVILVVYAGLAQISISKMFAGGTGAGLLLAALNIVFITIFCFIFPKAAPPISKEEREKYDRKKINRLFWGSFIPTLGLIFAVLGSIIAGIATPNEASAMGAVGAFALAAAKGKFSWNMLKESAHNALKTTSTVIWIIMTASMFTSVFLGLGGGRAVTGMINHIAGGNKWGTLVVILIIIAIMGLFMDSTGTLMIGVPLFTPILYALGFDPLWFGVVFIMMIAIDYLSPPFAYAIFYLRTVAPPEITTRDMYLATLPFMAIQAVAIVLVCIFPEIVTYLPSKL